jgi:hypothetical protein
MRQIRLCSIWYQFLGELAVVVSAADGSLYTDFACGRIKLDNGLLA